MSVVTLSYLLSASFGRASSAALCSSLPCAASFLPYIVPACRPPSSVRCFVKLQSKAAVYPAARFSASLSGVWASPSLRCVLHPQLQPCGGGFTDTTEGLLKGGP